MRGLTQREPHEMIRVHAALEAVAVTMEAMGVIELVTTVVLIRQGRLDEPWLEAVRAPEVGHIFIAAQVRYKGRRLEISMLPTSAPKEGVLSHGSAVKPLAWVHDEQRDA